MAITALNHSRVDRTSSVVSTAAKEDPPFSSFSPQRRCIGDACFLLLFADPVVPRRDGLPGIDLHHSDAALNRTDERAQIAPHTLVLDDAGNAQGAVAIRLRVLLDALMGAVLAGDEAKVAADALGGVNGGDDLVVEVEVAPIGDVRDGAPLEFAEAGKALGIEILIEAVDHVLDDAEPVVHHCRAHLDGPRAQADEFGRVLPSRDAADAADGDLDVLRAGG